MKKSSIGALLALVLAGSFPAAAQESQEEDLGVAARPVSMIALEEVAGGFTSPLLVVPEPGTDRLMVVDQIGVIHVIGADGGREEEAFLDLRDRMVQLSSNYDERGLLGLTFHPEYESNGKFYVHYSAPVDEETPQGFNHVARISEFTAADPDSERIILAVPEPQLNHNSGSLEFGPDGYLYVALGDGGGAGDIGLGHESDWYEQNEGGNAQNLDANLLGKILRIDVDSEEEQEFGSYGIPQDNPLVGQAGRGEIWAYGFRNPYRMAFDSETGRLFTGDAGQELWEEIDLVTAGGNYGWNIKEGTHCFSPASPTVSPQDCPSTDALGNELIDPIIEHPNYKNDGPGVVIVGGRVYRGPAVPELQGQYVYGFWSGEEDQPAGRLYAAAEAEDGSWQARELSIAGREGEHLGAYLLGFGYDHEGELYVTTTQAAGPGQESSGTVWKVTGTRG